MQYLQADFNTQTLHVYPHHRDWTDFNSAKHFEYHVATLLCFNGSKFSVEIDASKVPYSALLHVNLFVRIAKHARQNHKDQLKVINIYNPSGVARMINRLMKNLIPDAVRQKIHFVEDTAADKKSS